MSDGFPVARPSGYLDALRWCPAWVAALLCALVLPSELSFNVGGLRLTAYRLVLIAAFAPALIAVLSGRVGRVTVIDWLMITSGIWSIIVLGYHHGAGVAFESGGIRALELCGSYLLARAVIVDERSFRGAMALLFAIVCFLVPFVFLETVTGFHLIKSVAAKLVGQSFHTPMEPRLGLTRAFGPFDHPILLGVFAASALGVAARTALPKLGLPRSKQLPRGAAVLTAFSSLSSGPLAALTTQFGLLFWDGRTRERAGRWKILATLILVAYVSVDALSNRSGYQVFLSYLTFSAATAYNRIIIFQFGIQDVVNNPWLGIGFQMWTRPTWMHSASMDNFWLVQAVTYGVPGFLMIALAVVLALSLRWKEMPPRIGDVRLGWGISLIGMVVAATTVHFWNSLFVYFFFFLGAGAWFLQVKRVMPEASDEVDHA